MEIFISPQTAGRSARLKGNLRYFDRIITDELNKASFQSSFGDFWLNLAYPPMYVLSGVVGTEVDHKKYYNTLPNSRLDRKNKKIEVSLRAPEFSEHFDKAEQSEFKHKFNIENKYRNISQNDLAKTLIEKFITAGEIINSKFKVGDVFDFELFKEILLSFQLKINANFLIEANERIIDEIAASELKRAIGLREQRKIHKKPLDKEIRDLRVYCSSNFSNKALYPYDYKYTEIFLNLLRKKGLMCPVYNHLYIRVGNTFEDSLRGSIYFENWQIYGLSVIDYNDYLKRSDSEKELIVFESIATGLKDITDIDGLDNSIIDSVIKEIKENGLNTELEYKTVENNHYRLRISYLVGSMEDESSIFFTLTEKSSNKVRKILIGKADKFQIYLWLHKINITKTNITIKSSNSITAQVLLKDKPRNMEFSIKEIINE
ncbi:MAG: hypothetical protein ABI203_05235 [Mucilaginibacter sp.]